jgi:uncharacterized protein YjiK
MVLNTGFYVRHTLRWLCTLSVLTLAVFVIYIAVRFYHIDTHAYLFLKGMHAEDTVWNRPSAGGLHLADYRMDIDARPVAGVRKNLSGLSYDADHDQLIAVVNRPATLYTLHTDGTVIGVYPLKNVSDTEGVAYLGDGDVAVVEEGRGRIWTFKLPDQAQDIDVSQGRSLQLTLGAKVNSGFEGLGYDRAKDQLYVVQEHSPRALYRVGGLKPRQRGKLSLTVENLSGWLDSSKFATDLSSVEFDPTSGHLLLLSDESQNVMELDGDGRPLSMLSLSGHLSRHESPVPQAEGVAIDPHGNLYVVSEPNLFYRLRSPNAAAPGASPAAQAAVRH